MLKKQFGLPADMVSLRSLNLSSPQVVKNNAVDHEHHYNGVHYVIQLDVPLANKSRLLFRLIVSILKGHICTKRLATGCLSKFKTESMM